MWRTAIARQSHVMVFAELIALTLATVGLSFVHLGVWHTPVGLMIAACKAMLVAFFFMHLRHDTRLNRLVISAGLFWLAIMMTLTLSDYVTRNWLAY